MTKPFKIVCCEMDEEFRIFDHIGNTVAIAPTAMPHSKAKWHNKKIHPKVLWESISTEQERAAIAAVLDEPGITRESVKAKMEALAMEFSETAKTTRKHASDDGYSR
jgi:hypothetical protein